jgi:ribosomal protein S18 acetylase RimI-like enzyme
MQTQTMNLEISRIQAVELETFAGLLRGVAQELEHHGQKLWDQDWLNPQALLDAYGLESMHLGRINGEPVAGFVLIESDPYFWPNVPEGESLFVHKVVVARTWKGRNISSQVLDFAAQQVLARGRKFLRLDTDATRPALCNLYEKYGFTRVGRRLTDGFDYALYELEVRA